MTDLVPISLAQTLAAIQADIAELHRAIERATITPAPEWVRVADAARIEGVSASTIRRGTVH